MLTKFIQEDDMEHRPLFWKFFEATVCSALSGLIEERTKRIITEKTGKKIETKDLAEFRENFNPRVPEMFTPGLSGFGFNSRLMNHFCKNIARSAALDDAYNVSGEFQIGERIIWPESIGRRPKKLEGFWLGFPNGQAVRNRYKIVKELICNDIIAREKEFVCNPRILSIACGSAQPMIHAIYNIYEKSPGFTPVSVLLTDASEEALQLAKKRADDASLSRLFSYEVTPFFKVFRKKEEYNIIEACGILEYLDAKMTQKLINNSFNHLAKGGKILLSGMIETKPAADILRRMYNWEIVYRSPEELGEMVKNAGGKNVVVYPEPWGLHYIITAEKG